MPRSWAALRYAAIAVLAITCITHALIVVYVFWGFNPVKECQHIARAIEKTKCPDFYANVALHVVLVTLALWVVAAMVLIIARFLPWFISLALPLLLAVGLVWVVVQIWREDNLSNLSSDWVSYFESGAIGALAYAAMPMIAAWCLGFIWRAGRAQSGG
jgi:hypothetical protein